MTDTRTLISSATNGATELPAKTTQADRRAIHGYVTPDCHASWHDTAELAGVSVSAILEAIGPFLPEILADRPQIVRVARGVDAANRRRRR
jgi:hypothetical protein